MSRTISQSTLKRANLWKAVGLMSLLTVVFVVVVTVENLLVSSLLAFVISYMLGPMVNNLERQGISRTLATTAVFLTIGAILGLVGSWLFPYLGNTLSHLQKDMPRFIAGVSRFSAELEEKLRAIGGPLSVIDLTSKVEVQLTSWAENFFEQLPRFLRTFITVMLLAPFLAFFMVKDGRTVLRVVLGLVPNNLFEAGLRLQHQINFQIGQFVRARFLESLIVGLLTSAGLILISFPYPILLGAIAGLTNLIPYLGPVIGAVPALIIAAVNGYTSLDMTLLAVVYIGTQLIDAGFLIPMLVAKVVDLHPVTVIVVIIAGAQVMGILGMIISIPVASTLKVTVSTIYRHLIDTRT